MASGDDADMSSVEFTLEDTYEHLKDVKCEKEQEVKELIDIVQNNKVRTLQPNVTPEEILLKRYKFAQSLAKFVAQEQPKDLSIHNTPDFYSGALKGLEDEVQAMEELDKITDEEIAELESDIAYMEKKQTALELIKEASLNSGDKEAATNFEAEMIVTKQIFGDVKKDLAFVVDTLFPNNGAFQNLLFVLTRALNKGGDDLYITVTPDVLDFVNFLEEADIIQFHPNDKTKIKLRNL
ncbi:uncharacterized protein LOC100117389 [Nasonia vitripennis]|uniref:Uncharacterized protein n=1 Tax=Nasonia vitripennis TaxID=7425 RepID=A0A7M7LS06_NASVI|nr:uncharacterized protein LOC100117389 [Nasonia vitripennis]XP_008215124.2 uncharacterized protein LOC100117389 [Nasonia vitripennis]XP_008215131.2 uncharacterized protein LOC100117389 [Nasonia vitripennis]XP_008215136.2 uncharacterized protein LOC100117389 [Nasonia vitripennis]XP_032455691.1 uncharacterized protein LOC100117389 [Nasonia vitripennis]XP_032455693.1 uncharacterized protein LOC100117389 [Nasonia vitripennis]